MDSFASIAELSAYLRVTIDVDDPFAQLCLDGATQGIRDYTRQLFTLATDDVAMLDGSGTDTMLLPELPVRSVAQVIVDADLDIARELLDATNGTAAEYAVDLEAGLLFRRRGQVVLPGRFGLWPERRRSVQVKYTHGYELPADLPASIRIVCVAAAARTWAQDGATSETTGSYTVSYAGQPAELTDGERRALAPYRRRRR